MQQILTKLHESAGSSSESPESTQASASRFNLSSVVVLSGLIFFPLTYLLLEIRVSDATEIWILLIGSCALTLSILLNLNWFLGSLCVTLSLNAPIGVFLILISEMHIGRLEAYFYAFVLISLMNYISFFQSKETAQKIANAHQAKDIIILLLSVLFVLSPNSLTGVLTLLIFHLLIFNNSGIELENCSFSFKDHGSVRKLAIFLAFFTHGLFLYRFLSDNFWVRVISIVVLVVCYFMIGREKTSSSSSERRIPLISNYVDL